MSLNDVILKRNFKGFRSPEPLLSFSFFPPKTKPAREIFLDMTSLFRRRRPIRRRRCLSSLLLACAIFKMRGNELCIRLLINHISALAEGSIGVQSPCPDFGY